MKKINRNLKAVLFDMDGVLIDSETVYMDILYSNLVQKYGFLNREDLYPIVGMDSESTHLFLYQVTREPLDNAAFDLYMEAVYRDMHVDDYKDILNPGVMETLEFLKKRKFKMALASSSKMYLIEKVLEQCGIASFFDYVISGEQFAESKPNPEIYLTAMREIGCTPDECIVVEDSSYGIEAGLSAGTYVIAKKDERFNIDQSKADHQINAIDEIIELLID